MATTSYFSFTNSEKEMIRKMLQLSSKEYSQLEKNLDALLDTSKMCEEHQLAYLFYDDKQFYCPKCLTTKKPLNYHYVEEKDEESIQKLNEALSIYQNCQFPQINFEERAQSIQQQLNNSINSDNNQTESQVAESAIVLQQLNLDSRISQIQNQQNLIKAALEKRRKFVEVQSFISYISIEKNNRKVHDEMHTTDDNMRPKLESIVDQSNNRQNDRNNFDSIFQQFLKQQQ